MTGVISRVAALARRPRALAPPDSAAILQALPMPAVVLDGEDRFRFVNPAAELFFQQSQQTLMGVQLAELLPADHRLFALLHQIRLQDSPVADHDLSLESPRLHRHGVSVYGAPMPDLPGGVVLTLQDGSTAAMLDRQLHFLGAARGATAMAAMLAHEVKNPLSGIRGAAQLLEQGASEGDRELCQLIQEESDRIRNLVDRMEMFSDRPITRRAVNIHSVLDHVRRVAQTGFACHLRIVEEYDPSLPAVWGDRDQLIQILLNLVKNASEALSDGSGSGGSGEILLSTAYHHGVRIAVPGSSERVHLPLQVIVRDNGPGIPEALRSTLFEPFVTTKRGGQGLGLALVAKLVSNHGGLIECDSRPGRTTFRLSLPAQPPNLRGDQAANESDE
ncbi:two-component system sensor histidine kinase NtrB [Sediminicoccus sp. BL-A-41-H5]|uniref:two-component system sensor histidine kinase NtrB n=1 Tax=Sediminicoccus sp. BL-A-41-H5 TaxID=3421106 RepID=UPI003D6734F5